MDHDEQDSSPKAMRFESILQGLVPKGREGKHKKIITQLLSDISQVPEGSALKIPLAELPDSKENIRSALSRAGRLLNLDLATSSDENYLYVWKNPPKSESKEG